MGLNFERDLPHQNKAINAVINTFIDVEQNTTRPSGKNLSFNIKSPILIDNIRKIQNENGVKANTSGVNSLLNLDIKMETGTGKTYTYTKTIYELNKQFGINKFIIVVPTLPIRIGTEQFLKSESTRQHFKEQYRKNMELYVVKSYQKKKGQKKDFFPLDVMNFIKATHFDEKIHVLLINMGMLNSKTMNTIYDDNSLLGSRKTPLALVGETNPFVIIDEPHKFKRTSKSYKNILQFKPQCIIRYGATFPELQNGKKDYENLLYDLDAVKAFNDDLVKGVAVYVPSFEGKKDAELSLINLDGKFATFKYTEGSKKRTYRLQNGESLAKISSDFHNISIEHMNKSIVQLSNGVVLHERQSIHPSSYADTYQEILIKKAIDEHFKKEQEYFNWPSRIKPLTLFFIDDISSYREVEGRAPYIRDIFEKLLRKKIEDILKNNEITEEYKLYLEASLDSLSSTHGGYFSKDNTDKDENIQAEIEEILKDKIKLLSYRYNDEWNVRRFIFSKWTLKEGWDNPNIFTICKLRSSGSENSKIQEVGRGLRLPVNKSLFRVKNSRFELSYIVDFKEKEFAETLTNEINDSSAGAEGRKDITKSEFNDLSATHNMTVDDIFLDLLSKKIIDHNGIIQEGKIEELYLLYPELNKGLKKNKVRKGDFESKNYATVRSSNYKEFKELWEMINQKVLVDYRIGSDLEIKNLLLEILSNNQVNELDSIKITKRELLKDNEGLSIKLSAKKDSTYSMYDYVETIAYNKFLRIISDSTFIPFQTLHATFVEFYNKSLFDKDKFFTRRTAQNIIQLYNEKIADIMVLNIQYRKLDIDIHPTALTNPNGELEKIEASYLGNKFSVSEPQEKYLYNELYYDSNEDDVINEEISEVVVFGKIPKGSIRIPVFNGMTYSPDFAYVIKHKNGMKKLNVIIETKNKEKRQLSMDESDKIKLANRFFAAINHSDIEVEFREQLKGVKVSDIINGVF